MVLAFAGDSTITKFFLLIYICKTFNVLQPTMLMYKNASKLPANYCLKKLGRAELCILVAQYNDSARPSGPYLLNLLKRSFLIQAKLDCMESIVDSDNHPDDGDANTNEVGNICKAGPCH